MFISLLFQSLIFAPSLFRPISNQNQIGEVNPKKKNLKMGMVDNSIELPQGVTSNTGNPLSDSDSEQARVVAESSTGSGRSVTTVIGERTSNNNTVSSQKESINIVDLTNEQRKQCVVQRKSQLDRLEEKINELLEFIKDRKNVHK